MPILCAKKVRTDTKLGNCGLPLEIQLYFSIYSSKQNKQRQQLDLNDGKIVMAMVFF